MSSLQLIVVDLSTYLMLEQLMLLSLMYRMQDGDGDINSTNLPIHKYPLS